MGLDSSQAITTQSLLAKCHETINKRNQLLEARDTFLECVFHNINTISFDYFEVEHEKLNNCAHILVTLEQSFIKEIKKYLKQQIKNQNILEIRNITHEEVLTQCNTMKKNYSFAQPITPTTLYTILNSHTSIYTLIESYLTFEHEHQEQFFDIRWDVINS